VWLSLATADRAFSQKVDFITSDKCRELFGPVSLRGVTARIVDETHANKAQLKDSGRPVGLLAAVNRKAFDRFERGDAVTQKLIQTLLRIIQTKHFL